MASAFEGHTASAPEFVISGKGCREETDRAHNARILLRLEGLGACHSFNLSLQGLDYL